MRETEDLGKERRGDLEGEDLLNEVKWGEEKMDFAEEEAMVDGFGR